jgi:hypothetical protein
MTAKALEAELRSLLAQPLDDDALRARVEELARQPSFGGLVHVWGPALYRRNRVLFRPLLQAHMSTWWWGRAAWKGALGEDLDAWMQEVERAGDVELFRTLYSWKHSSGWSGSLSEKQWRADLLAAFKAATVPHERTQALAKYDLTARLDEATALQLYEIDPPATRTFILKHVAYDYDRRKMWQALHDRALARGDEDFALSIYRRQVSVKQWQKDVLALCAQVKDPDRLVAALEKRHPEGWNIDPSETFYQLAVRRDRDVVPYLLRHVRDYQHRFYGRQPGKLLDFARQKGWLDLWSNLVRVCENFEEYNKVIDGLLADRKLSDEKAFHRLLLLAGPSREWNFGREGFAQVHPLTDKTAAALYQRFPDLLHGPFQAHLILQHGWRVEYPKLTAAAIKAQDEALLDYLAGLAVVRAQWPWEGKLPAFIATLAEHYGKLLADPAEFARRAVSVLGRIPAGAIRRQYRRLVKTNSLARLLFEDGSAAYLDAPHLFRDLLEAPDGHVQALALRALARDDDRARASAAQNLDLLRAALLRPLHRRTRLWAFQAILNAATTPDAARLLHDRAREALDLPDEGFPKEELIGLIGRLLHRWPQLRGPRETPAVHEAKS